ncbi:unnamed protein product [marine sediment metagenome]|uniref:Uncharacterized protein n=1 Tax=marine sediment metagenome TaxID=412755 RepID=X1ISP6_9ZZZZ
MNLDQLERLRIMVRSIQAEIKTDSLGSSDVSVVCDELEMTILSELKDLVWSRYLETDH